MSNSTESLIEKLKALRFPEALTTSDYETRSLLDNWRNDAIEIICQHIAAMGDASTRKDEGRVETTPLLATSPANIGSEISDVEDVLWNQIYKELERGIGSGWTIDCMTDNIVTLFVRPHLRKREPVSVDLSEFSIEKDHEHNDWILKYESNNPNHPIGCHSRVPSIFGEMIAKLFVRNIAPETHQPDDCRAEFEKWLLLDSSPSVTHRKADGKYSFDPVQDMWTAWHAAWNPKRESIDDGDESHATVDEL